MLASYYGRNINSRNQFGHLKIGKDDSFERYLNRYNVIFLNMQEFLSRTQNVYQMLDLLKKRLLWEILKEYPDYLRIV